MGFEPHREYYLKRMGKSITYLVFPLLIFLSHLAILWLLFYFSHRNQKAGIVTINLLAYPVLLTILIAISLFYLSGYPLESGTILSGCVCGVMGYYSSLLLSLVPLLGPFFREPDLEFFLLGMGTVIGLSFSKVSTVLKGIGPFLIDHSLPLLISTVGALILSFTVRVLFQHTLSSPISDREDALKNLAWIASISAGVIGVPLVYLFQSIHIGG